LKLEAFNKEFVTASIIEEYKNKNQEIREEVRELEALKSERDLLTKELEELKEEKETIEW
jgi:cell division protein FtsB